MSRRTGEAGALKTGKYRLTLTRRSDRFLAGLVDASSVTFVSHVYPDPDSLGSMLGLAHLVETCLGKPTRLGSAALGSSRRSRRSSARTRL